MSLTFHYVGQGRGELPRCTLCALYIHCSYAQQTLPSAINTYKNANKTFTNVLKYVHECQHAAGNVSQGTRGTGGDEAGRERRAETSGNPRHSVTKLSQGYDLDEDVTAGAFYRDHDHQTNPVLIHSRSAFPAALMIL